MAIGDAARLCPTSRRLGLRIERDDAIGVALQRDHAASRSTVLPCLQFDLTTSWSVPREEYLVPAPGAVPAQWSKRTYSSNLLSGSAPRFRGFLVTFRGTRIVLPVIVPASISRSTSGVEDLRQEGVAALKGVRADQREWRGDKEPTSSEGSSGRTPVLGIPHTAPQQHDSNNTAIAGGGRVRSGRGGGRWLGA